MPSDPLTSTTADSAATWVELSLFYVRTERATDDPTEVVGRAEVLYGEGRLRSGAGIPLLKRANLGSGLHLLRVENSLDEIAARLVRPHFDDRLADKRFDRFTFGFIQRPPILGLPHPKSGLLHTPAGGLIRLHQFVRTEKLELLQRISSSESTTARHKKVSELFARLAELTGCDLRDHDAQWIGDVIIGEPRQRIAAWESIPAPGGKSCKAFEVSIQPGLSERVRVHVRALGLDGMCLCDRLLEWNGGEHAPARIDLSEELGTVSLRAWLGSELVLEEQYALLRGISTKVRVLGGTYTIQDRLTDKLEAAVRTGAADPALLERASRRHASGCTSGFSSGMVAEPWSGARLAARHARQFLAPSAADNTYFEPTAGGRAAAMLHIATLISRAEEAAIVDPWFDAIGAEELLTRIDSDVSLTVLTNLAAAHGEQRSLLVALLTRARQLLPPNLRVACAPTNGSGDQAFHDRFVLVRSGGDWRVFVLTNSFSGLAASHPLFVIETTPGPFLVELERLLDNTPFDQLWPPLHNERPDTSLRTATRGEFPGWRSLLAALVPRGKSATDGAWLRSAQARGFVLLTSDGLKWRLEPRAREAVLDCLLAKPRPVRFRTRRPKQRRRTAPRHHRSRRSRPFGIGRSVMIFGDLAARGFDVDPETIAARLLPAHGFAIERELRRSFSDPPDPTQLRLGITPERLAVRQALTNRVTPLEAARFAAATWEHRLWDIGANKSWARRFAYGVLAFLAPHLAVRLCEDLRDADFVFALVGRFESISDWPVELRAAMIASGAPLLHALGVHATAVQSMESAPDSRDREQGALEALKAAGVTDASMALFLLADGTTRHDDTETALQGRALATLLGGLPNEVQAAVVTALFEPGSPVGLMRALVDQLLSPRAPRDVEVLNLLVNVFARRFGDAARRDLHFTGTPDVVLTRVMGEVASCLARVRQVPCSKVIRDAVNLGQLQEQLTPLTPFRHRSRAPAFHVALGWSVFWELSALAARCSAPAPQLVPEASLELASEFLEGPDLGRSNEVRAAVIEGLHRLTSKCLFGDADVLVFLDESKSKSSVDGESLTYGGRVFYRSDPAFGQLAALLAVEGAWRWHASGQRSESEFLFSAKRCPQILALLNAMDSPLIAMPVTRSALEHAHIDEAWRRLRNDWLSDIWATDSVYARALFRCAELAFGVLEQRLPAGSKVIIVADRQDWLDRRAGRAEVVAPGVLRLGLGCRKVHGELWCIQSDDEPGARALQPYLGLVDSELWAVRRFLTRPLPGGETFVDRLATWRDRGKPSGEQVVSQEDLDAVFAQHAEHEALKSYWHQWASWVQTGRAILLREGRR